MSESIKARCPECGRLWEFAAEPDQLVECSDCGEWFQLSQDARAAADTPVQELQLKLLHESAKNLKSIKMITCSFVILAILALVAAAIALFKAWR